MQSSEPKLRSPERCPALGRHCQLVEHLGGVSVRLGIGPITVRGLLAGPRPYPTRDGAYPKSVAVPKSNISRGLGAQMATVHKTARYGPFVLTALGERRFAIGLRSLWRCRIF